MAQAETDAIAKPDTTVRCQNCGEKLAGSYWSHHVSAVERLMETAPDGGSISVVVKSALACSWRCLAVVIAGFGEPDRAEEPF